MKKVISAFLALLMCVSMATLMVSCGDHTHAFASEWSADATHHWHAAACEHNTEVSDKAEHTYGENNKCTVCQKEYTSSATVSAQVFESTIGNVSSSSNMKVDMNAAVPTERANIIIEVDAGKYCMTHRESSAPFAPEDSSYERRILEKIGENAYQLYTQVEEGGHYNRTSATSNMLIQSVNSYSSFVEAIKDRFADAVFDRATASYQLTLDTFDLGVGEIARDLSYQFFFENNTIKEIKVSLMLGQWEYTFDFTFGNASITIPQESHTFASEWTSDGTYHWHAATCEHTDLVWYKREHTFSPSDHKCHTCKIVDPNAEP